jgi:CRP-like cAMP-binding protein/GNAT superfamily N-acetyltransferase
MITVREAALNDVEGIRDVFQAEYGDHYAYPQYYDTNALTRLVYAEGSVLLVAVDSETKRVAGTASVVFSVGAHNDLVGEFGRLVVHPDFRGRGIGKQLMQGRLERVETRLHVGIVENRASHPFSQQISSRFGFVPIGFIPMKLLLQRRESVAPFVRYFADALALRRNHPRIIPEVNSLAGFAFENCGLLADAIIDDTSAPFPHDDEFELAELKTEGYASLLRIERGRLANRDVFGPIRLHYGLFQLRARHSHYLIARRKDQVAAGIGYMIDEAEKAVRVFELISLSDEPIRFLLNALLQKCQLELDVEYIEVDVSAYAPRMQRTLLELGFLPVSYTPANVFHEVERLDAIKMSRLLVPLDLGELQFCEALRPLAESVIKSFADRDVLPRIAAASQQTPLFIGLSDEQRQRLVAICEPCSFEPCEPLYRQGERDGTMHLLLAGEVELVAHGPHHLANVTTGQCVGETSLLYSPNSTPAHSVSAVAKTTVETAAFPNRDFSELIRRRPDIGVVIYRNLAADISTKLKLAAEQSH